MKEILLVTEEAHEEPCDCFICRGEASEEFIQSILDAEPGPALSAEEFIKRLNEEFPAPQGMADATADVANRLC